MIRNKISNINTEKIIEEQESSFGIKDFLKEAENYAPDVIKELNVSNIFNILLYNKAWNNSYE